jgi:hypothetical protein
MKPQIYIDKRGYYFFLSVCICVYLRAISLKNLCVSVPLW